MDYAADYARESIRGIDLFSASVVDAPSKYRGLLLGPELEFFVVDAETLRPRDCTAALRRHPEYGGDIVPEVATQQIEVRTAPMSTIHEIEARLKTLCFGLVEILANEGAVLLPAAVYDEFALTLSREEKVRTLVGALGPRFAAHAPTVASDQINIGARGAGHARLIFERLSRALPVLVRLGAASPFRRGRASRCLTERLNAYDDALARFPELTGPPAPATNGAAKRDASPCADIPEGHYKYMRPMRSRGVAAEIRCLDKQPTLAGYLGLLAIAKGIAADDFDDSVLPELGDPQRTRDEMRHGRIDPGRDARVLDAAADALDATERRYLRPLYDRLVVGSPAQQLRNYAECHGVAACHRLLAYSFMASLRDRGAGKFR